MQIEQKTVEMRVGQALSLTELALNNKREGCKLGEGDLLVAKVQVVPGVMRSCGEHCFTFAALMERLTVAGSLNRID